MIEEILILILIPALLVIAIVSCDAKMLVRSLNFSYTKIFDIYIWRIIPSVCNDWTSSIWSGDPPHSPPFFPQPPESTKLITLTQFPSSLGSTQISIFTAVVPFCCMLYIIVLNPTHLPIIESVEGLYDVNRYDTCHCSLANLVPPS